MNSTARSIELLLAKAVTRKALVMLALSSLVVVAVGMGVCTHKAYAAKVSAERVAQKQAATLDDVMAKLNGIESEMQQQARTLNVKLESLEYQNARLAAYAVRQHGEAARLETVAEHMPIRAALPPTLTIPLELETDVCHKGSLSASAKLGLEPKLEGFARGNVGLDEFGDGVEADVRVKSDVKASFEVGGDNGFETSTCLKIIKFNVFGQTPPTVDVGQFVNGITTASEGLADKLAQLYMKLPQLQNVAKTASLDTLNNLNLNITPQQALAALENPQTAFQNVSGLISSIPLPGNIRNFLLDPSSLLTPDLNPANFCANFSGSGPISTICSKIPSALADLQGVTNTISDLRNVQTDLANFKTGLRGVCSSVNGVVTGLSGTSITIPQLASFQIPNGINFTPPSLSTHTVNIGFVNFQLPDGISAPPPSLAFLTASVGPQTISSPFQFQPLTCPSF